MKYAAALLVFVSFGLLLSGCLNLKPPVSVQSDVIVSDSASVGQELNLTVRLRNGDSKEHRLNSVDLSKDLLSGLGFRGVVPASTDLVDIPVVDQRSFFFDAPLAPGSEVNVVFNFVAATPGVYAGQVSVCIDSETACFEDSVRVSVR